MRRNVSYTRLVIAAMFATPLLLSAWFLLAQRPELTRLSAVDPYQACARLMTLLDSAQDVTLAVALALALPHLGFAAQRVFSDRRLPLSGWFIGEEFSLTREVLLDTWLAAMTGLVIGLIEGVQWLFNCDLLLAA